MKLAYNDRVHGYWLDGKRCKGASSLGKVIDSTHALEQWRGRQIAKGIALRPALIEYIAAHIDDRKAVEKAVDEALEASKSNDASRRGTVLHKILERVDLGLEVYPTPMSLAVQDAWRQALAAAGLTILPAWVERVVVHPDLHIAGTLDRIVRRADGTHAVLDIKGGARATQYPNSISVQLAIYARATHAAAGNPERDGGSVVWDTFEPLPEMDTQSGYIAHIPEDNGEVFIHELDIHAGWEAVHDLIRPVLAWQGRKVETALVAEVRIPETPAAPANTGDCAGCPVPSDGCPGDCPARSSRPAPTAPVDPFAGLPDGKDMAWEIRKPVAVPSPSPATTTTTGTSPAPPATVPSTSAPNSGPTSASPFDDLPTPSTVEPPPRSPRDSDGWMVGIWPSSVGNATVDLADVPDDQASEDADPFTESPEVQAERALQRRLVLRSDGDLVEYDVVESMGRAINANEQWKAHYLRWMNEAEATGIKVRKTEAHYERTLHLADLVSAALKHWDDVMAEWQDAVERAVSRSLNDDTRSIPVPKKPKTTPDDIIRAAVCAALPDVECFAFPTVTTGAILTSLNHIEAAAAAGIAQAIRNGEARLSRRRDGSYHVADAA